MGSVSRAQVTGFLGAYILFCHFSSSTSMHPRDPECPYHREGSPPPRRFGVAGPSTLPTTPYANETYEGWRGESPTRRGRSPTQRGRSPTQREVHPVERDHRGMELKHFVIYATRPADGRHCCCQPATSESDREVRPDRQPRHHSQPPPRQPSRPRHEDHYDDDVHPPRRVWWAHAGCDPNEGAHDGVPHLNPTDPCMCTGLRC